MVTMMMIKSPAVSGAQHLSLLPSQMATSLLSSSTHKFDMINLPIIRLTLDFQVFPNRKPRSRNSGLIEIQRYRADLTISQLLLDRKAHQQIFTNIYKYHKTSKKIYKYLPLHRQPRRKTTNASLHRNRVGGRRYDQLKVPSFFPLGWQRFFEAKNLGPALYIA